jgi:outer membrane protein OmpA-like peptidoglycan-associated protein
LSHVACFIVLFAGLRCNFKGGPLDTTGDVKTMNKTVKIFTILALVILICPALSQADIVYIKNGDKLFGTIQSPSFTVKASYGKISIKNESLRSLDYKDGSVGRWTIATINNDQFSGTLMNDSIQFIEENGKKRTLNIEQIQRIKREISGPSYSITTTIFTMKNNDRFSGKFLDTALEIRANHTTRSIQPGEINRIEFAQGNRGYTSILLENGDLISGTLKLNEIRLDPDAVDEITVAKSNLKCIQFNAPKMVLNRFGNTRRVEKDSDGDGIPDFADICMDTPSGVAVGPDGCREKTVIAKSVSNHHVFQKQPTGDFELILFDFDRFELKSQYYAVLDEIALKLSQNPDTKIEIQGHTDNVGTAEYNQLLSEKRARTVKNYLVHKGVGKDRLFPVGFGYAINQASNRTESGRALNRRVEMSIMYDQKMLAYKK